MIMIVISDGVSFFFRRDAPRKCISGFLTETEGASARDDGLLVVPPSALVPGLPYKRRSISSS